MKQWTVQQPSKDSFGEPIVDSDRTPTAYCVILTGAFDEQPVST